MWFVDLRNFDDDHSLQVARGEVLAADAHAALDAEATLSGPSESSGDTSLSDYKGGGVAEAECLAAYWGPILKAGSHQRALQQAANGDQYTKSLWLTSLVVDVICCTTTGESSSRRGAFFRVGNAAMLADCGPPAAKVGLGRPGRHGRTEVDGGARDVRGGRPSLVKSRPWSFSGKHRPDRWHCCPCTHRVQCKSMGAVRVD